VHSRGGRRVRARCVRTLCVLVHGCCRLHDIQQRCRFVRSRDRRRTFLACCGSKKKNKNKPKSDLDLLQWGGGREYRKLSTPERPEDRSRDDYERRLRRVVPKRARILSAFEKHRTPMVYEHCADNRSWRCSRGV
jgi:hypothetical protein